MLRKTVLASSKTYQPSYGALHPPTNRSVFTGICCPAKSESLNRQAKIMSKLFGNRMTGSKKHWYPSTQQNVPVFGASQFGKPARTGNGKNTSRRMNVLNKLFMKHITDLLATGEASEAIVGRGLQVTRVKISPDFAYINVYWLGSGNATNDGILEQELHRCSGVLRHDLSQLALMGEVPRVKFAREKQFANLAQVESLLRDMDFGDDKVDSDESHLECEQQKVNAAANVVKHEFYGESLVEPIEEESVDRVPEMRHDVLGLDHRDIMMKILTKMRKSKQAWELHSQQTETKLDHAETNLHSEAEDTGTMLERVNEKLAKTAENEKKFSKFLAKRRDHKNTPERKKYDGREEKIYGMLPTESNDGIEGVMSPKQKRLYEEKDYLHEDIESENK